MEINIVGEANESNHGHPSQESDVTINAENSSVDEPDIIYDRSKSIDTFEDLGCAIELHEKIVNEDTELHSLDPRNYLFNEQEQEEGDYLFGQGIINEASIDDKEYLQLYESWCLFAYREFYKNLLLKVSLHTYGEKKTSIPNRFCKIFELHDDEKTHAFLMKLSNNTHSDFGLSYQTVMNNQSYTFHSGITQPRQFSLGNIPTMSCITDSIGEGWDDGKIAKIFNKRNNIVNGQEEVPILDRNILNMHTSSCQP
jgi:hypothetical protein